MLGEAGGGGGRLPGVRVVDELLDLQAWGDGVCEVQSVAVINNHDRPGGAATFTHTSLPTAAGATPAPRLPPHTPA